MDASIQAAIWGGTIAAMATVTGYLANQALARRERKATSFANALTAMDRYEDYPYRVWRRVSDDSETMTRLTDEWSAAGMAVKFHLAWLEVDSPVVGMAYRLLYDAVRPSRIANRNAAWNAPPRQHGNDMAAEPPLTWSDSSAAKALCLASMRNEIGPLSRLRHRSLHAQIAAVATQAHRNRAGHPANPANPANP
ncbi:MAG: hypothetical protein WAL50_16175 [Kineosporiaceae bacterium]